MWIGKCRNSISHAILPKPQPFSNHTLHRNESRIGKLSNLAEPTGAYLRDIGKVLIRNSIWEGHLRELWAQSLPCEGEAERTNIT